MDVVLVAICMAIPMVALIAINWVLSDMYRDLLEKNEAAVEEIIRLQQQNYYPEAENKKLVVAEGEEKKRLEGEING